MDSSDLFDYGPTNGKGYWYMVVAIDIFSKLSWNAPLKNNKKFFWKHSWNIKRKQILIESDDGKEFVIKIRTDLLKKNNN